ncbi:hypothetical protein ABEB36_015070 [Hypothenemus hampei]|uniref:Myb/SANT-like DNA-binding domain-containing protein n=1 Tax=Hypothenemus hampei TaxID=57062 RepID=A0ABD1E0B3_HYPHA
MEKDLIEISINYKGSDVHCFVTLEQAEHLLNDNEAAGRHAEEILGLKGSESHEYEENEDWSSSLKNNSRDIEATEFFLQLRYEMSDKFNDRKTLKNNLWSEICKKMNAAGYVVGESKVGIEKCRQKFANLQRSYINYVEHMKKTDESKRDPPLFRGLLHSILKNKDKIDPPYVEDSETENVTCTPGSSTAASDSDTEKIKTRFSSTKRTARPSSNTEKILKEMRSQFAEEKEVRDKEFKVLTESLRQQYEQREKFLDLFKRSLNKKRMKADGSDSSDLSD